MKRTKTNPFDWALIRWARACEEADIVDQARVEPTLDGDKDDLGRLVDPLAYLTSRANKVLESIGLSGKRWLERSVAVWLASTLFVVALGAIVFPFARVDNILGAGVNLAGPFLFFILGQIFFLTVSLVMVCVVCFQTLRRRCRHDQRPETLTERWLEGLSGLVGTIVLFVLQKCAPVFYKLFGGRSNVRFAWKNGTSPAQSSRKDTKREKTPKELEIERRREASQKGAGLFWDTLFSRPRFLFFWGGFLSHLFWTSCSLCVLLVLCGRMQGNRYDYCWRTSLEDEAAVKRGVDILGAPIAWLGGNVPDDADVVSLFEDRGVGEAHAKKNVAETEEQRAETLKKAAKTRARWSYFLLSVVFVWCVLPRLLLVGVYYFLFRRALRDYRPALEDEYYKKLIADAEAYTTSTASSFVDDPIASNIIPETLDIEPIAETPAPQTDNAEETRGETLAQGEVADAPTDTEETNAEALASENEDASLEERVEDNAEVSVEPRPENAGEEVEVVEVVEIAETQGPIAPVSVEQKTPEAVPQVKTEEVKLEPAQVAPVRVEPVKAPEPPKPPKPKQTLAFGYDADLSQAQWESLLPTSPAPIVFGDVAGDFALRKKLKAFLDDRGAEVSRCVYVTDVGLSPARHYSKFMRDVLTPAIPNARVYVVLSGGEKLRLKYGERSSAVSERLEDWTNALNALAKASALTIVPVFFYDADLDLPEQRARLRDLVRSNGDLADIGVAKRRNYGKWDASNRLVLSECRSIFSAAEFSADEEEERRRVARVCADIFELYREETTNVANAGANELRKIFGYSSILEKTQTAAANARSAISSSVARESMAVKDALIERCKEQGLSSDFIEQKLTSAWGLSEKMRGFCSKLSPKCAIATASVGLSVPALVAFAPLLGGAATATAVASTFSALGALLPTSVASGIAGGALGAVAPMSLNACKKKIVSLAGDVLGSLKRKTPTSSEVADVASPEPVDAFMDAKIESVAALVCVTTTWRVVLELQGLPEDEIAALTPEALDPIENSPLDSLEVVEKALAETRALLPSD